jgi:adenylosuccinate synthase
MLQRTTITTATTTTKHHLLPATANTFTRLSLSTSTSPFKSEIRGVGTNHIREDPTYPSRVCAVLGAQWGDEGKGKLADVLAKHFDIIARFNGGNNAGHTVVVDKKKYAFHLLPCGVLYPHTLNLLGNGCVIHIPALFDEIAENNLVDLKGRLMCSNRAHVLFDFHQQVDGLLEQSRGRGGIGTTKKGIGPCYTSKAMRNSIRMGDLLDWEEFTRLYTILADGHESQYPGLKINRKDELEKLKPLRERLIRDGMIGDTAAIMHEALHQKGHRILTEGANAVMLDIDHGTYPYVTSSSTTAGGVCTGLGLPPTFVDCTIGVVKAYTTRVGAGPFPTELTDDLCGGMVPRGAPGTEIGRIMQTVGAEIGVTTGRKRRCGWLDLVVLQYSHMVNGYRFLNITKLDVLNQLSELKLCVAYELDGKPLPRGVIPPNLKDLGRVKPVYRSMPGWQSDISKCKTYSELPIQAKDYLKTIEDVVGIPIKWIGTGVGRLEMLTK